MIVDVMLFMSYLGGILKYVLIILGICACIKYLRSKPGGQ